jgi:hypothetical protein
MPLLCQYFALMVTILTASANIIQIFSYNVDINFNYPQFDQAGLEIYSVTFKMVSPTRFSYVHYQNYDYEVVDGLDLFFFCHLP